LIFSCTVQYLTLQELSPDIAARCAGVGRLVYPFLLCTLLPDVIVPRLEGHSRAVPVNRNTPFSTVVVAGVQKDAVVGVCGQQVFLHQVLQLEPIRVDVRHGLALEIVACLPAVVF